MISAATYVDGNSDEWYEDSDNVKRIKSIIGDDDYNFNNVYFTKKDDAYTYNGFLQAAAKFPRFCGVKHKWGSIKDKNGWGTDHV